MSLAHSVPQELEPLARELARDLQQVLVEKRVLLAPDEDSWVQLIQENVESYLNDSAVGQDARKEAHKFALFVATYMLIESPDVPDSVCPGDRFTEAVLTAVRIYLGRRFPDGHGRWSTFEELFDYEGEQEKREIERLAEWEDA